MPHKGNTQYKSRPGHQKPAPMPMPKPKAKKSKR